MRKTKALVGFLLILSQQTMLAGGSDSWGVGFAAGPKPSISLQHRNAYGHADHYRLHYAETELSAGYDFQKFFAQSFLPLSLTPYSGFGVSGEARRANGTQELFHGRIPVGIEWNQRDLRMSAFIEAAARMGPFPKTTLSGEGSCGVRTVF